MKNILTFKKYLLKTSFSLVFIFVLFFDLVSQCNPPDALPSVQCQNAPLTCLSNYCAETLNIPVICCNGWCGANTIINNPQYIQFIATEECVEIEIHVNNCSGGQGLQSAIVTSCNWQPCPGSIVPCPDILACNAGSFPGTSMHLSSCDLSIGQTYWLLIDGSNGSTCQYTIVFISGIFEPQIDEELDPSLTEAIPSIVCQGYDDFKMFAGPTIANAHGYIWTLGWSGQYLTSTLPQIIFDIPVNASPGTWDVCVRAFSGCDTTEAEVCTSVQIVELSDVIKPTESFCVENFPFLWHNISIIGPGTYRKTFNNANGCPYDSIWTVERYPEIMTGQIDTISCHAPFFYEGQTYFDSGTYALDYSGMSANGCDSFAILNLTFENVYFFIEESCVEGITFLKPYIIESNHADTILYSWYNCNFDTILSSQKDLSIASPGCYCLILNTGFCKDTLCSTYAIQSCNSSCSLLQNPICLSDSILFFFSGNVPNDAKYHWLIERPGQQEAYYSEQDTVVLRYDSAGCYSASLTIVDDTSTITCIDSFCVEPSVTSVMMCCSDVLCSECTELIFNLTGPAPWTIILSNGHSLDTLLALSSPYVHPICLLNLIDTFSIISITGFEDFCPGTIIGERSVILSYFPGPIPEIILEPTNLCANKNMLSYYWHECNGTDTLSVSQCYVPEISGCYCVEITSFNSCKSITCIDFVVAIQALNLNNDVSIYPNPAKDEIQIQLPEDTSLPVHWELIDQMGIQRINGILNSSSTNLDFETVPAGIYFLELELKNGFRRVLKVVVE